MRENFLFAMNIMAEFEEYYLGVRLSVGLTEAILLMFQGPQ